MADGFISIIDTAFDRRGTLFVTELDEASWFALEVTGNARSKRGPPTA